MSCCTPPVFVLILLLLSSIVVCSDAWALVPTTTPRRWARRTRTTRGHPGVSPDRRRVVADMVGSHRDAEELVETTETIYTPEEQQRIAEIHAEASAENGTLRDAVQQALPTLPPGLILKLGRSTSHSHERVQQVALELEHIMDARVQQAKETLKSLLDAGEIRKLDSLIGQAQRDGKLDVPFFNVIQANLRDAMATAEVAQEGEANRAQVLQHIYTRCQEEMEKAIPPGVALLNKVLRTEQASIRRNLYDHYLTPQKNVVRTPDGREVKLQGEKPVLVQLDTFVSAIADAVKQIRTVEVAGATDRATAANLVESCRTIAKEARVVIGEKYGVPSDELQAFELGLQPVFRPDSPESPYVKGET